MATTDETLSAVLARLDALERDNEQLKQDNAMLKEQNVALLARVERQPTPVGTTTENHGSPLERMSRRWVLRRGMQAAAATAVAGVFLQQDNQDAAADHTDYLHRVEAGEIFARHFSGYSTRSDAIVHAVNAGTGPAVKGTTAGSSPAIFGQSTGTSGVGVSGNGPSQGVYGFSESGVGVRGEGHNGVHGVSSAGGAAAVWGQHTGSGYGIVGDGVGAANAGVLGRNAGGIGVRGEGVTGVKGLSSAHLTGAVYGQHLGPAGYGVIGDGVGAATAGVLGRNGVGTGIRGEGMPGVHGISAEPYYGALRGEHTGDEGYGVVADASGTTTAGVLGRNARGDGIRGEGKTGTQGVSPNGIGVFGQGGSGYGGQFQGTRAQVRLTPTGRIGKPITGAHQVGELYLDRVGSLFICTAAGTPGTWRKVTTTTA